MLYNFELCHNTMEATKNICEGRVDHSTVSKQFKNLDTHLRSGKSKTEDSEAVLQGIKTNPVSSTWSLKRPTPQGLTLPGGARLIGCYLRHPFLGE